MIRGKEKRESERVTGRHEDGRKEAEEMEGRQLKAGRKRGREAERWLKGKEAELAGNKDGRSESAQRK